MSEKNIWAQAMDIEDQAEADAFYEKMVAFVQTNPKYPAREAAEAVVKLNLGYFSGYYDEETIERADRLFGSSRAASMGCAVMEAQRQLAKMKEG